MPDLLTHVFLAYSLCRICSWRWGWLTSRYITLGMVGALIPDVGSIGILIPSWIVEQFVGVPFAWGSFATGGGVLVSVILGGVVLTAAERRQGTLLLVIGAGSHLLADSFLRSPTGRTEQLVWPISQYRVPSPGLYLSTDPELMIATGAIAFVVWCLDTYGDNQQI